MKVWKKRYFVPSVIYFVIKLFNTRAIPPVHGLCFLRILRGGIYISVWVCVCAGQGWTLFRNEPQSKVNFLFVRDLTQDTYISLLLKIRCQKPPTMLSWSHRIQFGRRALHCVTGAKTEVLWHLVFVLLKSHIAKPFSEPKGLRVGRFVPFFFYLPLLFSAALEFTSISV